MLSPASVAEPSVAFSNNLSKDTNPIVVPCAVVSPAMVRFPAIVGLSSIFAPVTASFCIFALVIASSAISDVPMVVPVSYTHLRAHETQ